MILSGILLNPIGEAWANQSVKLTSNLTSDNVLQYVSKEFITDSTGFYEVDIPNGFYSVSVFAGRFNTSIGNILISEDTTQQTINELLMLGQVAQSPTVYRQVAENAASALASKVAAQEAEQGAESSAEQAQTSATLASDKSDIAVTASGIASDAAALAQGAIDESATSALSAQQAAEQALANKEATDLAVTSTTQNAVAAVNAATQSKDSADRAELAATTIAGDAQSARDSAADALFSKNSAAASATTASDAATAAGLSKVAAKASEDAADASELAAGQSAATAGTQAGVATDASNLAKRWASDNENVVVADGKESSYSYSRKAATSATSAADSAGISGTQAGLATAAKTAAEAAAVTATAKAGEASASAATALTEANRSKAESDRAQGYASALTGSLVEAGSIDLSSSQYPAKPQFSSFWKVVVGGVVGGVDYGIGDTLVYSKTLDQFYKIDNTESVSSVNGKTGAVSLVKADMGLSQVDNTSDANKPVSTAQQTALNGKQASAANLTAFSGLTGAVDQLPYFTGAGALSLATLTAKARLFNARTDTAGMQTELGLVPVTSRTDTTPGRLVTAGYCGLGSKDHNPFLGSNLNPTDYRTGGSFFGQWVMEGIGSIIGTLTVAPCDPNWLGQTVIDLNTGNMFTRAQQSNRFLPWRRTYDDSNSLNDPQTGGGLMSATVVSGWTIEKFANGTMLYSGGFTTDVLAANVVSSVPITIPNGFVNESFIDPHVMCLASIGPNFYVPNCFASGGTTTIVVQLRNGPIAQTFIFRIKIIGRWK